MGAPPLASNLTSPQSLALAGLDQFGPNNGCAVAGNGVIDEYALGVYPQHDNVVKTVRNLAVV